MRERITFVQKLGDSIDPSTLKVTDGVLSGPEVQAVLEDRLTIALDELPTELHTLLNSVHELHVRWVSPVAYEAVSPLLSRLPPGFHLFFTPARGDVDASDNLCPTLAHVFGDIACSTPADSFTPLQNDRFSHSSAFQYFQPLESLSHFIAYAQDQLCPPSDALCAARLNSLVLASSLDLSYDTISHTLKITALWPYQKQAVHAISWPELRTEVGVLSGEIPPNLEPHEVGLAGLLTVLGQDTKPSATMFAVPSRHRDAESKFSARFLEPTGTHPTLQIQLESNKPPSGGSYCSAHAYFTLPKSIFADKYQLADDLFLASKNLTALRYISQPVTLKRPSGYENIQVPYPAVFWACTAEEGTKFPTNPFERVNLGYDGLFGPRTVFWHVDPRPVSGSNRITNTIKVPVLDLDKAGWVNGVTAITVLVGFAWVAWKLAAVYVKSGYGSAPSSGTSSQIGDKKRQ